MQNPFEVLLVFTVNLKCPILHHVKHYNWVNGWFDFIQPLNRHTSWQQPTLMPSYMPSCHTCYHILSCTGRANLGFSMTCDLIRTHMIVTLLYDLLKELDYQVCRRHLLFHKSLALPGASFCHFYIL